ncbi:hypothetical protein PVK06_049901 [Gossypium arboreum]|uniref:Uncharacterized protein n=1 Tax=Gossypium arboreum TaxID=29729 RepID=A0ABR0M9C7_GOSAR|nr:hypothetical protein PVK06_049901 [Gossypium arboreum]
MNGTEMGFHPYFFHTHPQLKLSRLLKSRSFRLALPERRTEVVDPLSRFELAALSSTKGGNFASPSVTELAPLTLTTGNDFTVTLSVTPAMNSPESQVICPRAYDCKEDLV